MSDSDWHFDWPSGYVRYKDGRREVWQDGGAPSQRPILTPAEREAIEEAVKAFDEFAGDEIYAATLRGLLERLGGGR